MAFWNRKKDAARIRENEERERAMSHLLQLDTKAREFIEQRTGVAITKLTDYESYIGASTGRVWATFRASDLTSNVVSSSELSIVSASKKTVPDGNPLGALLAMPNPYDSWEELVYHTAFNLKVTGNAYWLKDEMSGRGQPKALYPLLTANMKIVPDKVTKIKEYKYNVNGSEITYFPEEIIHFRRPHPSNFVLGLGDVEASSSLFNAYINRGALEEQFLSNGAQPSGILSRKGESYEDEDQWRAFKARFNAEYAGRSNAGKVAFLTGDWAFTRLGMTHQEMQSIEKERWAIEQVFAAHGVPLSVAGLSAASNYATARVEDMNFRRYTCAPMLALIAGKLNGAGGLAQSFNPDLRVKFNMSGLLDIEQVVKDFRPLVELGAMSLNELREQVGLSRSEDPLLDAHYAANNRVPLELSGMSGGSLMDPSSGQSDPNA
jgi:HK97 family phage portal protein